MPINPTLQLSKLMDVTSPFKQHVTRLALLCIAITICNGLIDVLMAISGRYSPGDANPEALTFGRILRAVVIGPLIESCILLLFTYLVYRILSNGLRIGRNYVLTIILIEAFLIGAITHAESNQLFGIAAGIAFCILTLPIIGGVLSENYREGLLRSYLAHAAHNIFVLAMYSVALQVSSHGG